MYRSYSHIDLDERRKIARWRMAGLGVGIIVEKLGRHRSTIFREIKRNIFIDKECHPPPGPPRSARRLRPLRDTPTRRVDGRKLGRRLVAPVIIIRRHRLPQQDTPTPSARDALSRHMLKALHKFIAGCRCLLQLKS